jgi:DNA-binding NarL/FixJ family response regulator
MILQPRILVLHSGVPGAAALARALGDEAPAVQLVDEDVLDEPPTSGAVMVLAMSPPVSPPFLERVLSWASRATLPPGLVGCVPRGEVADSEASLAAGLDDVMVGDVSMRELAARVRAVYRRVSRADTTGDRMRFGGVVIARGSHSVWIDGRPCTLTRRQFAVMRALVAARGRVLDRAALLDAAWGKHQVRVTERAVDNVIHVLRAKLGVPDRIETVRGVGFRIKR